MRSETSIARIGSAVEGIVSRISRGSAVVPDRPGYVTKTVIRKLIFACPAARNAEDCHAVTREDLQRWSPDESGVLSHFDSGMPADDMSKLVFDRPDWGLLISLWCCLVKPAETYLQKASVSTDRLTEKDADEIANAAAALHEASGAETTVLGAVQQWLQSHTKDGAL